MVAKKKPDETRQLAGYVHVDVGGGEYKVFGPNDEVPTEIAELIPNPKAWATDADDTADQAPADESGE